MADPSALQSAVAAADAVQLIGMPEARILLAQATVHIATAPKSNASYEALGAAIADVRAGRGGPVPAHLRDSHYAAPSVWATAPSTSTPTTSRITSPPSSIPPMTWWALTTTPPARTAMSARSPTGWTGCEASSGTSSPEAPQRQPPYPQHNHPLIRSSSPYTRVMTR